MSTVVVNWTTKSQAFAAGTAGGATHVQIFAADGVTPVSAPQQATGASATFPNIPVGSYVAKVKRYDSAGNAVLGEATAPFAVAPSTVNVDVPDVVTVAVS